MLEKSQLIFLLNEALGQTAKLRKGGNELVYFCSKCHHVKRKLEICIDETSKFFGVYHCWTCSISGTLGKLLRLCNAPTSLRNKLYQLTKDVLKTRHLRRAESIPGEVILPDEFHSLIIPIDSPEYKNARWYLKQRGITLEDILRYNIGYGGEGEGEYNQHIIIPSYDADCKLNFFIGRRYYTDDKGIPYKKPDVPMSNIIGFESFINYNESIVLVESPFNAITIRNNAIPLFGKYPSRKLYEAMLINKVKKVYVCLDTDAEKDALDICEKLLELGISPYFVEMTGGKDPNEIGFKKMRQFIRDAREVDFQFLMNKKLKNVKS